MERTEPSKAGLRSLCVIQTIQRKDTGRRINVRVGINKVSMTGDVGYNIIGVITRSLVTQ